MTSFPADLFDGQTIGVLGLGRNGMAAARALAHMGARVQAWDDTTRPDTASGVATPGLSFAPFTDMTGFDALVMSPGIPHVLPTPHPVAAMARAAGVPILSDADFLFQAVRRAGSRARFVGITGTNGKSTTTVLLAHLLRHAGIPVAEGGNLGPAALSLPLLPDNGVYVLEMSSYMLERLGSQHFDAACLLNLTPDHLDRHGDMEGYSRAKVHIFDRQGTGDLAVIGNTVPRHGVLAADLRQRGIPVMEIGGDAHAPDLWVENHILHDRAGAIADLSQAPSLPGTHNAENAAAAVAIAQWLGCPRAGTDAALASFDGLPHRQKTIGTIDGIRFIDDSKATNADAAARAMSCHDRMIWIAGGVAKAGGIEDLSPLFAHVVHAFLIGRDAPQLARTLERHGVAFTMAETMERAVPAALAAARAEHVPTVLLSPACASFDQFTGFEARGHRFAELVHALAGETDATAGQARR
ncbi:UDP-N-acetylmuramoyl-L-alanine--D-glutamate ligase [Novacetimonas pomaceti]|uniref:UDP-N-acetylmuramoylalanine--D-glutamate ligase n=1 Tax=Novacetimonas pomaceti TaxID=2021998 RepID=A0A318QID5_9PROT|nr:UDP-N-acetylmuramoyl-L-alanine--D-glutamate ligase [Novacetimonas pomaceti]PYD77088.1 UDP-N-acetylmuramoyl-L-alanine--D-glutamate ligase [Novacetimonas pomaceti]